MTFLLHDKGATHNKIWVDSDLHVYRDQKILKSAQFTDEIFKALKTSYATDTDRLMSVITYNQCVTRYEDFKRRQELLNKNGDKDEIDLLMQKHAFVLNIIEMEFPGFIHVQKATLRLTSTDPFIVYLVGEPGVGKTKFL